MGWGLGVCAKDSGVGKSRRQYHSRNVVINYCKNARPILNDTVNSSVVLHARYD